MKLFQRKKAFTLAELPIVRKPVANPEQSRRAFTLIELLVVIAIIAILATIIVISVINAQVKARDNKRRADVRTIANALQAYHLDTKSWLVSGPPPDNAGTGYISSGVSTGTGWFNFYQDPPNTYSKKSIATALIERKFLTEPLKDPKMTNDYSVPSDSFQYMVYECPIGTSTAPLNRSGLAVFAKLENQSQEDESVFDAEVARTDNARCDIPLEMNFMVAVH